MLVTGEKEITKKKVRLKFTLQYWKITDEFELGEKEKRVEHEAKRN